MRTGSTAANLCLLTTTFLCTTVPGAAFEHPCVLTNKAELAAVKGKALSGAEPWKSAWAETKSVADAGLGKGGWHIADTETHLHAGGGGYTSDAYWVDRKMMDEFAYYLTTMGVARHITGEAKYSDKAGRFIDIFFFDSETYMKPVYRGDNMGTGGIYKILKGADLHWPYLGTERQAKLKRWSADYAKSLLSNVEFGGIGGNHNRADTWVLCLITCAILSEDYALVQRASEHFRKRSTKSTGELSGIGGGGGETKFVMYSFVAFKELVLLVEIARHQGIDLYSYDQVDGRSKYERMCDFYANWAYHPENHPEGKTKPGSGEGEDVDMYEIVNAWKQKPEYLRIVNKVGRPINIKESGCGPVTLTHAAGAYAFKLYQSDGTVIGTIGGGTSGPDPLVVSTASLPSAYVGKAYDSGLEAYGGAAPYTWSVTGGALPAGLNLSASGAVAGTPTGPEGSSSFTVQVKDGKGATANRNMAIEVTSGVFSAVALFGDAANWEPNKAGLWQVALVDGDKRYVLDGSFGSDGDAPGAYSLVKGASYDDFTLTFKAKSPAGSGTADFVAIFGYRDPGNFYYVIFNATAGYNQLFKLEQGRRTALATASQALITDSDYHEYTVSRAGASISVARDGAVALTAEDATFGAGRVGVGAYNDPARFDDISITTPASVAVLSRVTPSAAPLSPAPRGGGRDEVRSVDLLGRSTESVAPGGAWGLRITADRVRPVLRSPR